MKLEVAIEDVSQCVKDLTIEVPAEEVKAEFNKVYEVYQRKIKLPGFRPGRIPREIVKQRFGKELKEEVANQLMPHALQHALEDRKYYVVTKPEIRDYSINEGAPLKFTASIEIMPEFELKEYKGLKVTERILPVSDEEVENALQALRQSAAELVTVEDRPSQTGDVLSVNLIGKYIEPKEEEDLKADDVSLELGAEGTLEAFNENLSGVNAGDVREFRVVYAADFPSQGLSGKTIDFTATVLAVRRKELAELDDDFANRFGENLTLERLRRRIRADLVRDRRRKAKAALRQELIEQFLQGYDFDVPPSLVEQQALERAHELARMLEQKGMSLQSIKELDWEKQLDREREQATRELRAMLITSKISQMENLQVSPGEIDAAIAKLADETGEGFAQLKARLTKEETLSSIENRLLYQKTFDLIVNNAEIVVEGDAPELEAEDMKAEATLET